MEQITELLLSIAYAFIIIFLFIKLSNYYAKKLNKKEQTNQKLLEYIKSSKGKKNNPFTNKLDESTHKVLSSKKLEKRHFTHYSTQNNNNYIYHSPTSTWILYSVVFSDSFEDFAAQSTEYHNKENNDLRSSSDDHNTKSQHSNDDNSNSHSSSSDSSSRYNSSSDSSSSYSSSSYSSSSYSSGCD